MAASVVPTHRRPPALYRAARALRWLGIILLVLLLLYAGTVAYSAYEAAHTTIESRTLSGGFVSNGTIDLSGSFTLSNPGFYPINGLTLTADVANVSGIPLGTATAGPDTVAGGSTGTFPITILLPISESSAAESLLFVDQYLEVRAWANVTYAYLFPLSVALSETRSWGAPFEGFRATFGTPTIADGTAITPVTLTWSNHASFVEQGSLAFVVVSSARANCGGGTFATDVPAGTLYDQTQDVTLTTGCSPAGGQLLVSYSSDGYSIPFPPEPIP